MQRIEWRDGKTRFTLGKNFYLEMSNRIQPRFTLEMPDQSVQLAGTAAKGDSKGSFRIRRAKFKLEGWFYKPELEFEVQLNWPDASTAQPNRFVEDANIDWDISKKKTFRLRFGQFKAPFGRQQLTSSGAQQFVDRAIQDERYNDAQRDGHRPLGYPGREQARLAGHDVQRKRSQQLHQRQQQVPLDGPGACGKPSATRA